MDNTLPLKSNCAHAAKLGFAYGRTRPQGLVLHFSEGTYGTLVRPCTNVQGLQTQEWNNLCLLTSTPMG
jgi:hypothetical protein